MNFSARRGHNFPGLRRPAMAPTPEPERRRARLRKLRLPRACGGPVARREAERHLPCMTPHKACNFSIRPVSRADGRSAVAAAAYRAGAKYFDERTGRFRDYRSKRDVASVELVGWDGSAEALWNAAEAAETRSNSRVARDFMISLPAELPLDVQVKLVRGYALWLRDRFGTPSLAAIHTPVGHVFEEQLRADEEIIEDLRPQFRKKAKPKGDPRNVHAHILTTTREWDASVGRFGEKVRKLDDREHGPGEVQACRDEWQKRVNSALVKQGFEPSVDLRSYKAMAAAGDASEELIPQPKRGPASVGRSRRLERDHGVDDSLGGNRQQEIRKHNEEVWEVWELRRDLARARAREDGTSEAIAASREAERRERAMRTKQETASTAAPGEAAEAVSSEQSFRAASEADPMLQAIRDAQAGIDPVRNETDEFDEVIDPEHFESPDTQVAPRFIMRTVRRDQHRQRLRGE